MGDLTQEIAAAIAAYRRKQAMMVMALFCGGGLYGVAMFAAGWVAHG